MRSKCFRYQPFASRHLSVFSFIDLRYICLTTLSKTVLYTQVWELVTITLQALSLVKKAEPAQICLTLRLRDQRSRWMQDGCKVYMDPHMGSNGSCFQGHLDYFQKRSLGGRPNTKPGDHETPNAHNHWFILFYLMWGPAWIEIHCNSIWLRVGHIMTSHYMILEVSWDGVWTLSFGLSQLHGHGSWLVCEVALRWTHGINNPHP